MNIILREKCNIKIKGVVADRWNEEWELNNRLHVLSEHVDDEYSYLRFKLESNIFTPSEYIYKIVGDETNLRLQAELSEVINGFTIKIPYSNFVNYLKCVESIDASDIKGGLLKPGGYDKPLKS